MPTQRSYLIARAAAATLGIAAAGVLLGYVLSSASSMKGFSWLTHFISTLADRVNPGAELLNEGFIYGGGLGACAMVALGLATGARGTAMIAATACVCVMLVGVYPLQRMTPHLISAGGAVLCILVATGLWWRGLRRLRPPHSGVARGAALLFSTQVFSVVGAVVSFVAMVGQQGMPRYIGELTVRAGGVVINPVAALEWVFFATALVALVAVSVATPWRMQE